jgi:hypothetical protein
MADRERSIFDAHIWLFSLFVVLGCSISFIVIVVFATFIEDNLPDSLFSAFATALLTASSIIFGFALLSHSRFLDQTKEINNSHSELALWLAQLHEVVVKDSNLSKKQLSWSSGIRRDAWGYPTSAFKRPAAEAIEEAYGYILTNLRSQLSLIRNLSSLFYLPILLCMCSIFFSLVIFVPGSWQKSMVYYAVVMLTASGILSIALPLVFNRLFAALWDMMYNLRQQIRGGLSGILPFDYSKEPTL